MLGPAGSLKTKPHLKFLKELKYQLLTRLKMAINLRKNDNNWVLREPTRCQVEFRPVA